MKNGYQIDSQRLKGIIKKRNLTQEDLSALTGISAVTLSKVINGEPCRYATIWEISNALDIFPGYLMGIYQEEKPFTQYMNLDGTPIYFDALGDPQEMVIFGSKNGKSEKSKKTKA